ncbi:sensor histidine kinase [Geotalea daltonii FRC-32]|uniref:Sensor histidine kinase n=1 Tax=Geotalea daltonii (strain DSM 22248 / JCM 15807 / FRC-32) TaxID=316067 RepID=B9M6B6_GEODF|nr:HAMP domain-containing sensor histidine kinase [Geotalea daltonii]ACM21904.1 sensor histidine kinase [Geotalea daltonii FRC-32]
MADMDYLCTYLNLSDSDIAALYERADPEELQRDIAIIASSPVVDGLMQTVGGLFAVLNESRQILAANDTFLKGTGVKDALEVIGLRPGEAIHCVHAGDSPGGCGTGRTCASCGTAIAIVVSLLRRTGEERKCVATVWRNGGTADICLNVRATPFYISGRCFLVLMLQDISEQENWAEIQSIFFHDIRNMATGLVGASELLACSGYAGGPLAESVHRLSLRLESELRIQQNLIQVETGAFRPELRPVAIAEVIDCLRDVFISHPMSIHKHIQLPSTVEGRIATDLPLLLRVLSNMITNALEGSDNGDEVRLWLEEGEGDVTFCVWNSQPIPDQISGRIFQRYFSTKAKHGRGIGTFMMKYLGERALNGKVRFTSSAEGTIFRFTVSRA